MDVSQVEVRCNQCNVSFPAGTRRCMHCGGRTGPSSLSATGGLELSELPQLSDVFEMPGETPTRGPKRAGPLRRRNRPAARKRNRRATPPVDEVEAAEQTGGAGRMAVGGVWLLLALLGTLYRACTGGA